MADKTWKAFERRVAKFFGTVRNSLSGGNSKMTRSDSLHDSLFIEDKYSSGNQAVITLYDKTVEMARVENKIPVICLGQKGRKGFWIVVHNSDLTAVANQREVAIRRGIEVKIGLVRGIK